jgi:outer membrane protein
MKKGWIAVAVLALVAGQAMAQESPWLVRARMVNLQSANDDTTGLDLSVNNKTFAEVDISYFFSPNVATELILALPQKHTLKSGTTELGTLRHLPPTLTLQYHFTAFSGVKPYLGAGLNYTRFTDVQIGGAGIDKSSTGFAFQAGLDFPIDKNWSLNLDVKQVYIKTNVSVGGTQQPGEFKINPTLVGLGLGYRF